MSDRGIHPDLLAEETAAAEAPAEQAPARRPSRRPPAAPPSEPASESPATASATATEQAVVEEPPAAGQASSEQAEWLEQVRQASDPREMLKLLTRHLPKEDLSRDDTLAGMIGDLGNKRAKQLLEQQRQETAERAKREAAQKGDLYALGELAAPEVLQRAQQDAAQAATSPFLEGVRAFQETLPAEVQADVAGRDWPGSPAEGVRAYLQAVTESAIHHGFDQELKRREPALRKAWLSESNGAQPVPELEGGSAASIREITDEQIDRMSLAEFDAHFDDQGNPKPGVRVRLTRGIPLQRR